MCFSFNAVKYVEFYFLPKQHDGHLSYANWYRIKLVDLKLEMSTPDFYTIIRDFLVFSSNGILFAEMLNKSFFFWYV